jgi:cytochrome c peroxidase
MKKRILLCIGLMVLTLITPSFILSGKKPVERYRHYLLAEMEQVIHHLELMVTHANDSKKRLIYYHQARKHYKHIELFVEFNSPVEAKFKINGPLVPKSDPEFGSKIFYPNGFQAIEELITSQAIIDPAALQSLVRDLILALDQLKIYYASIQLQEEALLEMLQYELYRIAAHNLNGYDATLTLTGLQETGDCLDGMEALLQCFTPYNKKNREIKKLYQHLLQQIRQGKMMLAGSHDYGSFNRLNFIRSFINPFNTTLVNYHHALHLPWMDYKKALNLSTGFLFGAESFNMGFFSMYYNDTIHLSLRQDLGKRLFFDPVLSENNERSCATCHNPKLAFTDGLPKSKAINGVEDLNRNAPTLVNVAFQQAFFYDGRAYQLEQQAIDVIHNPVELNGDLNKIAIKLRQNQRYRVLFAEAFQGTAETEITPYAILACLAAYERNLIAMNSRFDQYLRGNDASMNAREINGYNLFGGKALCGSCHFFPVFNGTVPPFFNDTEFEILGTPHQANNTQLDADLGRYTVTHNHIHQYSFKTPTLRNIELTGPYMHNGVYNTLDEVMEFYHKGGGAGLGFEVPNQTLPFDSLQLSPTEKEDIILFLKTLTDTTSYGIY